MACLGNKHFFRSELQRMPIFVKAYSSQETLSKMIAKNVRGNCLVPHREHAAKSGNIANAPHFGRHEGIIVLWRRRIDKS